MIIVKNDRSVYIPEADRHIGFENDHLVESRLFQITDRELFDFSFKLDIKNTLDIVDLSPYVKTEDSLVLRWDISSPVIGSGGIITAQVRAFDAAGERVWHSAVFELVSEASVNAEKEANNERTITEFEQLEARVQAAVEEIEDSAVQSKQYAEDASQSNSGAQAAMTSVTATAESLLLLKKEYNEMTGGYMAIYNQVKSHCENAENPHGVTAEQIGTYTKAEVDAKVNAVQSFTSDIDMSVVIHKESVNPHNVTAEQVGAYTKAEVDSKLGDIETALDTILAMQQNFTGGETA